MPGKTVSGQPTDLEETLIETEADVSIFSILSLLTATYHDAQQRQKNVPLLRLLLYLASVVYNYLLDVAATITRTTGTVIATALHTLLHIDFHLNTAP